MFFLWPDAGGGSHANFRQGVLSIGSGHLQYVASDRIHPPRPASRGLRVVSARPRVKPGTGVFPIERNMP